MSKAGILLERARIANEQKDPVDEGLKAIKNHVAMIKKEVAALRAEGVEDRIIKFRLKQMGFNAMLVDGIMK